MLHSEGLEKRQGHRVLAVFGAFRILLGGSTHVQHPSKIRNLSHFLEVLQRVEICNWTFSTRWLHQQFMLMQLFFCVYLFCFYVFNAWPLRIYILAFVYFICSCVISLNAAYLCPRNSNCLFTFSKLIIICLNNSVWPEIIDINTKIIINATAKLSTFFLSLPRKCYFYYSIILSAS